METFEQTNELPENELICTASRCILVRWSKPKIVEKLMFVSKNVLLMHIGKILVLYNVKTKKEVLVVARNDSIPSDVSLPLDSIYSVCCSSDNKLALAEYPPIPKVVICQYPDLQVLTTLIDSSCPAAYKSILFLTPEYLIGLRDYPAFDLIVWAWQIQEKLIAVDTGFIQPNQLLQNLSMRRKIYLSLTEHDVKYKLQLWTLYISYKTVYAKKTPVEMPDDMNVQSSCWTSNGWFVFYDSLRNSVYRTKPGAPNPEMCVEYTENNIKRSSTMVCPIRQGFMLYTSNELRIFEDTTSGFTEMWKIAINHTLQCIVAEDNNVYGWSYEGILLELTNIKEQALKFYGANIKYFTFIKPTDEMVATINEENILQLWNVSTGEFKSEMKLSGIATHVCSNPFYNYVTISFETGKVELIRIDPNVNDLKLVAKLVICDEELSSVHFLFDGQKCIVASFPTGQFYLIDIILGQKCSVIREYHLENELIDIDIFEDNKSSLITVLYKNKETTEMAGNNFLIFDTNFNIIFELKNSKFYYTSISKWNSSDELDVINIAFTLILSKRIHLMKINITLAKILEFKDIILDHMLNHVEVAIEKNHFITFSCDGTYNFYVFKDEKKQVENNWIKILSVNYCSHWQTKGLKAAQVDVNGRNILTLSYSGNFMCTGFNDNCDHNKQMYIIDKPIFVNNIMETEGIGSEDDPKTRTTWTMINKSNILDADNILYSEQKNEIMQDYNDIKNDLLTLLEANDNGLEETRINIEDFDLNVDYRQELKEKYKIERQNYEMNIHGDTSKYKIEIEDIIKEHWDFLFVKPKAIYCLKELWKVNNYSITIQDQEIIILANQIIESKILMEVEEESVHENFLTGSISHRLIDYHIENLNSQHDYFQLEKVEDEIILLKFVIIKLKYSFNKLFNDLFDHKQHQLNNLREHNNSLRKIESEFRLACKMEFDEHPIIDYEWNQYEQTDQLINVRDDEVPVKPYNFTSQNIAKEELSGFENFRRQALITMMDGVLEKRWEDELKTDALKPENIINKRPEDYTEEDFKAFNEYNNLVAAKNKGRLFYKGILEENKTKINEEVKKKIIEFDNQVLELYKVKLEYDSAINQEYLKINRISKMLSDSDQRKQQIKLQEKSISEIEKSITEMNNNIMNTEMIHISLIKDIEIMKQQDNKKQFISIFPSKYNYQQAFNIYNRKPILHGNKDYSLILGYQFINNIIGHDKPNLLNLEFVKYLDTLKMYDNYKNVEDYGLNLDKEIWQKVCYLRRIKIECELKISTFEKDKAEKVNLLNNLIRDKEFCELSIKILKSSIIKLKNEDIQYANDIEIQLVLKYSNIYVKTTGHQLDFYNTTLVAIDDVNEVNSRINEFAQIKRNLLSKFVEFENKYEIELLELKNLKEHKLELYKYRHDYLMKIKMTKNMLHYLEYKKKGLSIVEQLEHSIDRQIKGMEIIRLKEKKSLILLKDELSIKIKRAKKETSSIEEDIDLLCTGLLKLKLTFDNTSTNKLKLLRKKKLNSIMQQSVISDMIKNLLREINVLDCELQLLLLKTYPSVYDA